MSQAVRRRWLDWIFKIRYRLLLVNVLVVVVPLIGISFARFYEKEMLRNLEDDMIHQGEVLREGLVADPAGLRLAEREPMLMAAARGTRTRIRLLDAAGSMVADSHRNGPPEGREQPPPSLIPRRSSWAAEQPDAPGPAELIDLASRPEVLKALRGEYGAATRVWENGDRLFLFSALPVHKDGKVQGVVYVTRSTNVVRAALYRFRTTLLKILAAAVAATAVLSLLFARTISRPLSRLTRMAERIAAGDRARRLELDRRDEIGQLARAVDQMARNLEQRARYTRELAANISHEFKSPLTSIRGASELLLEGAAEDPAARARFLRNILADAHRLDRLVSRLLEFSRIEDDATPSEVFDFEVLVREAAAQANGSAPVNVVYKSRTTQIRARRAQIASVLGNLIDNAEQFATPGTSIEVHVGGGPRGMLRTSVRNQGPSISEANLPRIWDRFFTTRADQGGTGLGLPIVSTIVAAHGGSVSVRSSDEEGTVFSFDLPKIR
ncbi:MAG: HAMP domain-containing protein [Deltaproteobacteria bacterium]|nr:HAMP domain-containing protein [Deltaproteobacteria bacterium]